MFNAAVNLNDVGHAIQLALAPVFLLTGIAGMLNVMAGRLARIIDRGRQLTEGPSRRLIASSASLHRELTSLEQRRHLASAAITACTLPCAHRAGDDTTRVPALDVEASATSATTTPRAPAVPRPVT